MSKPEKKKQGFLSRFFSGDFVPEEEYEAPKAETHETQTGPALIEAPQSATQPLEMADRADIHPLFYDAEILEEPARAANETSLPVTEPEAAPQKSWLQRLTGGLVKTSSKLSESVTGIFTKRGLDTETLEELEDTLIQADFGLEPARRITQALSASRFNKEISPDEVRSFLADEVEKALAPIAKPLKLDDANRPHVILVVGVNGAGKTTTIGKLAKDLSEAGKSVMLAAGDTFRAAAIEQLKIWGERTGSPVISRAQGSDATGLAYEALQRAQDDGRDVLIIDTAGRLQNKTNLMAELEKIVRVLKKVDATAPHDVLLILDATTGQNALQQVELFRKAAGVTGIIMTKLDGTARGGILVAIADKFGIPVHAIGVGEGIDDLQTFSARDFARAITASS
ncbi:MAG: signal recognition particle-docking protein FtsY [Hyphomicrobiales bacterium]|nr:signal recognition particle-docking protein FtsY [Hyphomicrobiales bacterium]